MKSPYYFDENINKLVVEDDCNYIMLVLTDANANNNKFYELKFDPNSNIVTARYGRVNYAGTETNAGHSHHDMVLKANSKVRKGYRPVAIQNTTTESSNEKRHSLLKCATNDLIDSASSAHEVTAITDLLRHLVETNRHQIMKFSSGQIEVDDDGLVKTALGIVPLSNVIEAQKLLAQLQAGANSVDDGFVKNLNQYLTLIPQKVPSARGWASTFFTNHTSFDKQFDFLEQLKASIETYEQMQKDVRKQKSKSEQPLEQVFSRKIRLVTDDAVIQKIHDYFRETINHKHPSSRLKLVNVYELIDDSERMTFENKVAALGGNDKANIHQYWHGTRTFNLLSILKSGLIIPKSNGFNVTGRMFGDGVYFSDQSTKALNYSYGVWGGERETNNIYMFLADVAMGKTFKAYHKSALSKKSRSVYPQKGYDSTHAKGGVENITQSGYVSHLQNDEMIVYSLEQIRLRYLCEFSS